MAHVRESSPRQAGGGVMTLMEALQNAVAAEVSGTARPAPRVAVGTGRTVHQPKVTHFGVDAKGRIRIDPHAAAAAGDVVGEPGASIINSGRKAPDARVNFAALARAGYTPGQVAALLFYERCPRVGKGSIQNGLVGITALIDTEPATYIPLLALVGTWFGCWRDLRSVHDLYHARNGAVAWAVCTTVVECFAADLRGDPVQADSAYRALEEHVTCPWTAAGAGGGGARLAAKWLDVKKRKRHGGGHDPLFKALAAHMFPTVTAGDLGLASVPVDQGRKPSRQQEALRKFLRGKRRFVEQPLMAGRRDLVDIKGVPSRAHQVMRRSLTNVDKKGKPRSEDPGRVAFAKRYKAFAEAKPGMIKGGVCDGVQLITAYAKRPDAAAGRFVFAAQHSLGPCPVIEAQWEAYMRAQWTDPDGEPVDVAKVGTFVACLDFSGSMTKDGAIFICLLIGAAMVWPEGGPEFVVAFGSQAEVVPLRFPSDEAMRAHLAANRNIQSRATEALVAHRGTLWATLNLLLAHGGHAIDYGTTNWEAVVRRVAGAAALPGAPVHTIVAVSDMNMNRGLSCKTPESIDEQSRRVWNAELRARGRVPPPPCPRQVYWNATKEDEETKVVSDPATPNVLQFNGPVPRLLALLTGKAVCEDGANSTMLADAVFEKLPALADAAWEPCGALLDAFTHLSLGPD
jgi:hypothetical protein